MDASRKKLITRLSLCGIFLLFLVWSTVPADTVLAAQSPSDSRTDSSQASADDDHQPTTTISVGVKVVNVLATVRDKHGEIVRDLTKDDFVLNEDGRAQSIHYFAQETDLPLTLGLLVDTSLSQRRVLEQERSASFSFLQNMLRIDKDQAFVIHFDHEVELLQDLTSSDKKLESALDALETPQFSRSGSPGQGGGPGHTGGGHRGGHGGGGGGWSGPGTLLYDAVYLASDELMKKQQGRKAVVVLTDGVDTGSKETLEEAIESAQRADTVVYCILFKDDEVSGGGGGFGWPGGGGMGRGGSRGGYPQREYPDGKKVLERLAKETGGRMFQVSKKLAIGEIYAQIGEELRHQYNLGYTPNRGGAVALGYHKIQLTTKQKGLTVQTRDGYYADR